MDTTVDFMCGWLRGFFDGEGSVHARPAGTWGYPRLSLSVVNTDRELTDTCQAYLHALGVRVAVRHYPRPDGFKDIYMITISRRRDVETFAERVGFATLRKKATLLTGLAFKRITKGEAAYPRKMLEELYVQQGLPLMDIAERLGKCRSSYLNVRRMLRFYGIPERDQHSERSRATRLGCARRRAKMEERLFPEIVKSYVAGETITALMKQFGVGFVIVKAALAKHDAPLRSKSEAIKIGQSRR